MVDPLNPQAPKLPDHGLMQELQAEVTTEATPLLTFILQHIRVIVGAVCILVLSIVGTGAWHWYTDKQAEEAQNELGRVLVNTEGAVRVTTLQALLPNVPDALRISVLLAIGSAAVASEQYDVAASAYGDIVLLDSEGTIGIMACLNQVDLLLREDKAVKALALLDVLEPKTPEILQVMLQETIAAVAEQANAIDRALAAYEYLLQVDGMLGDTGYFESRIKALRLQKTTKS